MLTGDKPLGDWLNLFVGREPELERLQLAWNAAKAGTPQIVALVAESGFGKTRLAQELFNWLSVTEDEKGDAGYWPDRLLRVADNLQLNSNLADCPKDGRPMPFFWWGLRLTNPEGRNNTVSSAIRSGEEYLKAHLAAYTRAVQIAALRAKQVKSGGLNVADLALNTIPMAIPVVGTVFALLGAGKTAIQMGAEVRGLEQEIRVLKSAPAAPHYVSEAAQIDLVDLIIEDLRRVAFDPPNGMPAIPIVLMLDDLQWAEKDPAVCALIEKSLEIAKREQWPLLIVATCWEQEWQDDSNKGVRQLFIASGVQLETLLLGRTPTLDIIVRRAFSGLSDAQVALITQRADGNPRFLDELIKRLEASPRYFINRNIGGLLTPAGECLIASETFEDAVMHRLQRTPPYVQMALGLASLQGVRFSPTVVESTARHIVFPEVARGLVESERPYAFTSRAASDASEFRALAYQLVAKANLPNMVDLGAAEQALRQGLADIGSEDRNIADQPVDVLEAQLALFDSDTIEDRDTAFKALSRLIEMATLRLDVRMAGRLAQQWADRWVNGPEANATDADLGIAFNALMQIGDAKMAAQIIENHVASATSNLGKYPSRSARERWVYAMLRSADAKRDLEGAAIARPIYEEVLEVQRDLNREFSTEHSKYTYNTALFRLADAISSTEGPATALPLYLEALPLYLGSSEPVYENASRRASGVLLERISTGYSAAGDFAKAREFAERSLVTHRALWEQTRAINSRRDVSVLELMLGQIAFRENDIAAACGHCNRALEIRASTWRQLGTPQSFRDYEDVFENYAEELHRKGEFALLRPILADEIAFRRAAISDETAMLTGNLQRRHMLQRMSNRLWLQGDVMSKLGDVPAGLVACREAVVLVEDLVAENCTPFALYQCAFAHSRCARLELRRWQLVRAISSFARAKRFGSKLTHELSILGWNSTQIIAALRGKYILSDNLTPVKTPDVKASEPTPRPIAADDANGIGTSAKTSSEQVPAVSAVIEPPFRNALCPCGSERRFKHCHGAVVAKGLTGGAPPA